MTFAVRSLGPVARRRRGRLGRKRVRRSERLSARQGHSGQQLRRVFADRVEFTVPRLAWSNGSSGTWDSRRSC